MLFEDIVILDEIRDELFPLQDEEKRLLEESILKEGIREPLIVWIPQEGPYKGKKILVDGHNRLDVAKRHNLKFKITIKQFSDLEEVLSWVVRNQLGRRNLTDEQKRYLYGKLYNLQKKSYGDPNRFSASDQIDHMEDTPSGLQKETPRENNKPRTSDKIAESTEYTGATIRRYGAFAEAVDHVKKVSPTVAYKILNGEVKDALTTLPSFTKKAPEEVLPDVVKKIEEGEKSIKSALKKVVREKEIEEADKVVLPPVIDIRFGDFKEVLQDVEHVDVIITDPPYRQEEINSWDVLGEFAQEKLNDGGYLIAYSGQSHLFEVQSILSKYLDYVWVFCLYFNGGPTQIVGGVNVVCNWKPILVFGKNIKKFEKPTSDVVLSNRREKDLYDHQQNLDAVKQLVETFSKPGDIVCDPFVGSGTTAIACKLTNRQFVGAEINEETYKLAVVRLSKEQEQHDETGENGQA